MEDIKEILDTLKEENPLKFEAYFQKFNSDFAALDLSLRPLIGLIQRRNLQSIALLIKESKEDKPNMEMIVVHMVKLNLYLAGFSECINNCLEMDESTQLDTCENVSEK